MAAASLITPKSVREFPEYLDFERLRLEGIGHIQDLAGNLWTDHNSHDPGITILEVLCYALTDLGYRTNLDIRDLLAREPNTEGEADNNFATAAQILSCNPLTILDFRKLLIDIEGVRNAWLVPADGEAVARAETGLVVNAETQQLDFMSVFPKDTFKNTPLTVKINGLYKILLELDDAYLTQEAAKRRDPTGDIIKKVRQTLHTHRDLCEDFFVYSGTSE